MKKFIYTIVCIALAFSAASCSGKKLTTKELNTEKVGMWGKHSDYVEVIGDVSTLKYNVSDNGKYCQPSINVTFRLRKEVKDLEGFKATYGNIDITLVDAEGGSLDLDYFRPDLSGYGKLESLLAGKVGDEVTVTFTYVWNHPIKDFYTIEDNAHSFDVNDLEFSQIYSVSPSSSSASAPKSTNSSSGDARWDSILDDYEKYIDDYIKVAEKINNGDLSALNDSVELMETAERLGEQLEDGAGELSTSQMARYVAL